MSIESAKSVINVFKIGGNQLDDPVFIAGAAAAIKRMAQPPVIVHGGGKSIKNLQQKLNIQPHFIGGLRVTDDATLEVVMMVLCGQANVMLVAALMAAGVEAQGFNGADRGLLTAQQMTHPDGDLGHVGRIVKVRADVIHEALTAHIVPVIAPVSVGAAGGFYNVNADQAAGSIAAALGADRVTFLTDVPGVLRDGVKIDRITKTEAEQLIAAGIIKDGMAVKLNAALDALSAGVRTALITNLDGLIQDSSPSSNGISGTIVSI